MINKFWLIFVDLVIGYKNICFHLVLIFCGLLNAAIELPYRNGNGKSIG